jgi:hypothetical protein
MAYPMTRFCFPLAFLAALAALFAQSQPARSDFDPTVFKSPPAAYRGHAMWRFNLTTLNEKAVIEGIEEMAKLNYGGFFIEASGGPTTGLSEAYLQTFRRPPSSQGVVFGSDEYFRFYHLALEEAKKQGLEVILYDDYSFPTGTVAGQLYSKYPEHVAKNLNMAERDATGPTKIELAIPKGIYVGAVMMNRATFEVRDISDHRTDSQVTVEVPPGEWKVMAFYLTEGKARVVDYLDPKAMTAFMSLTYEKYFSHFGSYFGNLITQTFYDEPSMHHADRMWTLGFNAAFEKQYGYSPMKYYPALWYDIGPQTAAARNALFGFRARLFGENFIKRLNDWCAAHGLQFGGHLDQEEPLNPVPLTGDLLKVFQYQTLPTIDDIWWYGRSNPSYKIVTSAAFNYDHPIARAETYSAYRGLTEKIAFQVAMDQFAMGINFQIPDRTEQPARPQLNDYVGRLGYLLQHGRHVADVAVLYPIASLQADYHFIGGVEFPRRENEPPPQIPENVYAREGGFAPGIDYQDVGESLYRALRVDYTYLHPEVLVERCSIENRKLVLNNRENREEYSVLILSSGETLSAAAAERIKEFYNQGGMVIATGTLPTRSAEFGKDKEIRQAIAEIFGVSPDEPLKADVRRAQDRQNFYVFWYYIKKNKAGGQALFLPTTHPWLMDFALKLVLPLRDVDIQAPMDVLKKGNEYDGALTYIHKVKNGRDIYFFANSSPKSIDTKVVLRGRKNLRIWNPRTGELQAAEFTPGESSSQAITTVRLVLPSVTSLFFIGE